MRGMGLTRLVESSFVYFLIQELSKDVTDETPTLVGSGVLEVRFKPIVPTKPVVVKYEGDILSLEKYDVYPEDGRIKLLDYDRVSGGYFLTPFMLTSAIDATKVTVSYSYNIVTVVNYSQSEEIYPPLLAVENVSDRDIPFELGSSADVIECLYQIHLYGSNVAQRDDIADWMRDILKKPVPIWNFKSGFPVLGDGRLNRKFDVNDISGHMEFGFVTIKRNPLGVKNDPIEESRVLISCAGQYLKT